MSASYSVSAIIAGDKDHLKKVASYQNFELIGVPVPAELEAYFDDVADGQVLPYKKVELKTVKPSRAGVKGLEDAEYVDGFVIDVASLPVGTIKVIFEVSY